MFELYSLNARRCIFQARYAASQFGSPSIDTTHLLLGLLRENHALPPRFLPSLSAETLCAQVEARISRGPRIPTSVDLPLSDAAKQVLAASEEESRRLGHSLIGSWHLFLGLLREPHEPTAAFLVSLGTSLEEARAIVANASPEDAAGPAQPESIPEIDL